MAATFVTVATVINDITRRRIRLLYAGLEQVE